MILLYKSCMLAHKKLKFTDQTLDLMSRRVNDSPFLGDLAILLPPLLQHRPAGSSTRNQIIDVTSDVGYEADDVLQILCVCSINS